MPQQKNLNIALVHDHLLEFGGAERVFVQLTELFPDADIYTSAYDPEVVKKHIAQFHHWNVHTSWAMKIPFFKKIYSPLRFLTPFIWESFDFSTYDLVISSTGWFMSKGIMTKNPHNQGGPIHISYIHHPPSYLYGYETAMEWKKYWPIRIYALVINHFLRMWDFKASQRPDMLIANSQETRSRIQKFYRRDATVIYPPVHISHIEPKRHTKQAFETGYYLTLSRLAYKKHVDLMIEVANARELPLIIIGSGRDEARLRELAGPTVTIKGYVPDAEFDELFSHAKAFLNCAVDEEFGIAPVEALGRGVPVIAYASGGLKETIQHMKNGILFDDLTQGGLSNALDQLNALSVKAYEQMCQSARKSAMLYTEEVFAKNIMKVVNSLDVKRHD